MSEGTGSGASSLSWQGVTEGRQFPKDDSRPSCCSGPFCRSEQFRARSTCLSDGPSVRTVMSAWDAFQVSYFWGSQPFTQVSQGVLLWHHCIPHNKLVPVPSR